MNKIIIVLHDLRSTHNVGAILRTADALAVEAVYFSGYTPYPTMVNDDRLPHLSTKINNQINKTALGAIESVKWFYYPDITALIKKLRSDKYTIAALEQTPTSVSLNLFRPPRKLVLVVGNEVTGLNKEVVELSDLQIEIPMLGKKESLNVSGAAAIALYHARYFTDKKVD